MGALDRFFHISERGSTLSTEMRAGAVTFLTMSYIIFVQPVVLGIDPKIPQGGVMMATCVGSALATFVMAILANYPIALAPAMGHNFYFAGIVRGMINNGVEPATAFGTALGANFVSGVLLVLLSAFAFRERLIRAIPDSLRLGIAVGIGLLIARVGYDFATGIALPGAQGPRSLELMTLSFGGLVITAICVTLRVKGAMLIAMILTAVIGLLSGVVPLPTGEAMQKMKPTLDSVLMLEFDFTQALKYGALEVIFVFFFLDLFDTVGTLVAVAEKGGFMRGRELPKAGRALFSDAVGTCAGTLLGTSTITSYIESAAGISEGARTGLANLLTATLFLLSLLAWPVVAVVGSSIAHDGYSYTPAIAPVLIMVGFLIMGTVVKIEWEDYTEAIPAFLAIIIMPLTLSITDGIAVGFIFHCLLKLVTGRGREVSAWLYIFSLLFIFRYALVLF